MSHNEQRLLNAFENQGYDTRALDIFYHHGSILPHGWYCSDLWGRRSILYATHIGPNIDHALRNIKAGMIRPPT